MSVSAGNFVLTPISFEHARKQPFLAIDMRAVANHPLLLAQRLLEEKRISPVESSFDHVGGEICGSRAGIHLRTLAALLAARSI